jgi:branched-chain amino acid transport system substrate-binding protein
MLLILSLALVLSSCQVATPQPEQAAEPEAEEAAEPEAQMGATYKIGFAPGVTGGGSFLGEPERNVAEIIAAQLEEAGGIVGPDGVKHEVEVLIGDTETNPDVAVSVARRYVDEDEVVAVVAGSVTPISLAVAAVAEEAEVPYISMASSLAIVTDPDTGEMRPWVFKVAQSNGDVAVWQAERATALGSTSVCYLYENTGYGKDCFKNSAAALEAAGFETVYEDSFERTDTEFPQVPGVQAAGCDVVVVGAIPQDFIATAGDAAEGMEMPCSAVIIAEDVAADNPQKDVFVAFNQAYTEHTGQPVSTFGGHGWDSLGWVRHCRGVRTLA